MSFLSEGLKSENATYSKKGAYAQSHVAPQALNINV